MHSPVSVLVESGRTTRRVDADIVTPVRFAAAAPGGYTTARFTLARPLRLLPQDVEQFALVTITDTRTAEVLWDGWIEVPGRGSGEGADLYGITAVGSSAHVTDNDRALSYVDSRYSEWEQDNAQGGTIGVVQAGGVVPVLQLHVNRGTVTAPTAYYLHSGNGVFSRKGQKLGRIDWGWDAGIDDPGWELRVYAGTHIVWQQDAVSAGGGPLFRRIGSDWTDDGTAIPGVRWQRIGPTGPVGDDVTWARFGGPLRVQSTRYAGTGVELVNGSAYANSYVLAHQVVGDLLGRPGMLPLYDGNSAIVASTSTAQITQLTYDTGANPAQVLVDLMQLEPAFYWAAWERNPATSKYRFEWSTWPTRATVLARTEGGYTSSPSTADLANVVRVRWVDHNDRQQQSIYTQDVPALTAAGRTRTRIVDLGSSVGSQSQADAAGAAELAASRYPANSGTLRIGHPILDLATGRSVWPWQTPRLAGRLIHLADVEVWQDYLNASDRDGVGVFRIVSAEYDDATGQATLALDSYESSVVAALGRIRSKVARVGRT